MQLDHSLDGAEWRISTFSDGGGSCVAVAKLADGSIAVRNSIHPDAGVAFFTPAELDAFLKGARAGEFDDMV